MPDTSSGARSTTAIRRLGSLLSGYGSSVTVPSVATTVTRSWYVSIPTLCQKKPQATFARVDRVGEGDGSERCRVEADQAQCLWLWEIAEEPLACAEKQRVHEQAELVDEAQAHQLVHQDAAAEDGDAALAFCFELSHAGLEVSVEHLRAGPVE